MVCKHVQKLLADYRNGLLDEDTYREVDEHLAQCETCRNELKVHESVSRFLSEVDPLDAPESLASQLMVKVTELEKKKQIPLQISISKMSITMRWLLGLSILSLFIIIAVLVFPFKSNQTQFYTTYGQAGYTLMGLPDTSSSLQNLTSEDFGGYSTSGGYLGALAVEDEKAENEESDQGRVVHTFDFDQDSEDQMISDYPIEEP